MINDARCICKIKSSIATAIAAISKKKNVHQQIGLKFKGETSEVLHLEHSFVWSRNLDTEKSVRNTWNVLKCSAGEGCRRSDG
jgi:hypothetical protein